MERKTTHLEIIFTVVLSSLKKKVTTGIAIKGEDMEIS